VTIEMHIMQRHPLLEQSNGRVSLTPVDDPVTVAEWLQLSVGRSFGTQAPCMSSESGSSYYCRQG